MKTQIASVLVALILLALAVIPARMPNLRPRKRLLWMRVIALLGSLGAVIVILQAVFQYEETKKSEARIAAGQARIAAGQAQIAAGQEKMAAVQVDIRGAVAELVAQGRLSREDGRRILRVFSKELADSLAPNEVLGIQIQRGEEKP